MLNAINTKKQGDVGMGCAIRYFLNKGNTVAIPISDSQPYDLIIDDGKLRKVQVKTTTCLTRHKKFKAMLETAGGNQSFHTRKAFDYTKVDYLFIVTSMGQEYLIPSTADLPKRAITLGEKYSQFLVL